MTIIEPPVSSFAWSLGIRVDLRYLKPWNSSTHNKLIKTDILSASTISKKGYNKKDYDISVLRYNMMKCASGMSDPKYTLV